MKHWIIYIALFFSVQQIVAQKKLLLTKIDTTNIRIGEEFKIQFELPKNGSFATPTESSQLSKFEINRLDETKAGNNTRYTYYITSFDTGIHVFPPFTIYGRVNKTAQLDSFETEPFAINVLPVVLQPNQPLEDIKPPIQVKKSYLGLIIFILSLIIVLITFYYLFKTYKPIQKEVEVEELRPKPPHEIAWTLLDKVGKEKIWQEGKIKAYYTEITFALRQYMEGRFDIDALEQTSFEIINALKPIITQSQTQTLRRLFEISDFVKFAKSIPTEKEHIEILELAFSFVNETKIVDTKLEEDVEY